MHSTPETITPAVWKLCAELVPDQQPVYLDVEPAEGAKPNYCFPNVVAQVAAHGGRLQHGWQIWEMPGLIIEAEFHGVWVDLAGVFHDITPKKDREDRILFLADPTRVYEGRQVKNVRHPLGKHPAILTMIAEFDRQFEILNRVGSPMSMVRSP